MDVFGRFSLSHFLVVLFPGLASGTGLALIALATPAGPALRTIDIGLGGGALVMVICYVLGVVLASESRPLAREIARRLKLEDPRWSIPPQVDAEAVTTIVATRFHKGAERKAWSDADFYIARALVRECLPRSSAEIERQNVHRQMRENLAIPIVLWSVAGLAWILHFHVLFGLMLSVLLAAIVLGFGARLTMSLVRRMNQNSSRVVREICLALIVGESIGLFNTSNRRSPNDDLVK